MAKQKNGVNKSQAIRDLLKATPKVTSKEAIAHLHEKGIEVSDQLFYFVKGKVHGRKQRKRKAGKVVATVASNSGVSKNDALATILKVKSLADEVGGMKRLKALIEALSA
jgi:hypothetical protein